MMVDKEVRLIYRQMIQMKCFLKEEGLTAIGLRLDERYIVVRRRHDC
jgi:hypothetical protein